MMIAMISEGTNWPSLLAVIAFNFALITIFMKREWDE